MRISLNTVLRELFRLVRKTLRIFGYLFLLYLLVVAIVVWVSGDDEFDDDLHDFIVSDITRLNPIPVANIIAPTSVEDIVKAIQLSRGPISIGGGRFSMGGQTAIDNGLQIDMRDYDDVVSFLPEQNEITVQAGMSWRELQEFIDPHDLSVKIMQTYANFSVGGSVSVNVHGRYIGHGPIISSVKALQLVLADGSVVRASRDEEPQLFYAAVGGYGGIGVISEVTLALADNERVERRTKTMPIADYGEHFAANVRDSESVVFHNADIYPPDFSEVRDVSWHVSDKELTISDRLIATDDSYFWLPKFVSFSNSSGFGKWARRTMIDPAYYSGDRVAWRNWEASYDVRELGEGDRSDTTWVLQEYFIPVDNFDAFVPKMREIFTRHDVDVVNVSIRHALADPDSYLSWARSEVFAFVVYHSQGTSDEDEGKVTEWTREMIDAIIEVGGAYYLPYQPHATPEQFRAAYPNAEAYFAVKRQVDPEYRFQNKLWEKYLPTKRATIRQFLDGLEDYKKGEEQTFLSLPEWYLVFNPNEYADFLTRGENPSDFPFMASIDEYWSLYDRVTRLTDGVYPENSQYKVMLWVIGVSTTAEFVAKAVYENTIGRITRWTASADTPEDFLIQEAHSAYGEMIYNEPWYKFPFWDYVGRAWGDTPFFGENFIRKTERKILITAEFGFKALYAKAIGFGAEASYGLSAGEVTMHVVAEAATVQEVDARVAVVKDFGDGDLIVRLPRWGGFSEIMPKLADAGVQFVEISGNDEIVLTTTAASTSNWWPPGSRLLFESMVTSPAGRKRSVYLVRIEALDQTLHSLAGSSAELEHLFDF